MTARHSRPARFAPAGPLAGRTRVPGDKSISHRALILAALAIGESRIEGLLEGEDVRATAAALAAMGAHVERDGDASWRVRGVGVGALLQPEAALDMGNSGTSARLLMGLAASHDITATFIGDASLSRRPMGRVIEPLARMGAEIKASPGAGGSQCLPAMLRGIVPAVPIAYRLPVASAQVKSAVLLAALNTPGITRIIEPEPSRDHSERMLAAFGADLWIDKDDEGARLIAIRGEAELEARDIAVPGDPSSAAFPIVAALLVPGSDIIVEGVGINKTRSGLFEILREMGAAIEYENQREIGGEPVADIRARHSALKGVEVPAVITPRMIDEFPILFVAAALAEGTTRTSGLAELRVKESDRLALMAEGLRALGANVEEKADGLLIEGSGGAPLSPENQHSVIGSALDHRIAMSFAVAGLVTEGGLEIDDMSPVATSFPGFESLLEELAS